MVGGFFRPPHILNRVNISFSMETEKVNKLSFLNVGIICKQGKFITIIYQKTSFSGGI